jgi:uncharacterized membrane protein YhaH (DUF805 family)
VNWVKEVFTKYAVFEGRARRKEYWFFTLFVVLVSMALAIVDSATGTYNHGVGLLGGLFSLAILVPGIAVTVRRLHDTDRSGWWVLIWLVPFVGWIVLIVFMCLDSQPGANRFGPNPKGVIGTGTGTAAAS